MLVPVCVCVCVCEFRLDFATDMLSLNKIYFVNLIVMVACTHCSNILAC